MMTLVEQNQQQTEGEEAPKTRKHGIDDYFEKPFSKDDMDFDLSSKTKAAPKKKTRYDEGDPAYRIFEGMRLRKIIKENHPFAIKCSDFNSVYDGCENMICTVGGCQCNVYDNTHCGDNLDLVSQFPNLDPARFEKFNVCFNNPSDKAKEFAFLYTEKYMEENIMNCCAWTKADDCTDALIACGDVKGQLHILSLAHSKQFPIVKAHHGPVDKVYVHPKKPSIFVTFTEKRPSTAKLWKVRETDEGYSCKCLLSISSGTSPAANISCVALSSDDHVLCGMYSGDILKIKLDGDAEKEEERQIDLATNKNVTKCPSVMLDRICNINEVLLKNQEGKSSSCSTVSPVAGDNAIKLVCKSLGGAMSVVEIPTALTEVTKRTEILRLKSIQYPMTQFDTSECGQYMCIGSTKGDISIFNLLTGKFVFELCHDKVRAQVTTCKFAPSSSDIVNLDSKENSEDCEAMKATPVRQIVFCTEDGYIFRYDFVSSETLKEWENLKK
eukprot:Nk52_evm1s260 gene=Nk52_evmTU1s260